MCRESYYLARDARDALAVAVDRVQAALGTDTPKHVALSALISAGAGQVDQVIADLTRERAAALEAQLAELRQAT